MITAALSLIGVLMAFANANVIPRASTCYSVQYGYLQTYVGAGSNSSHYETFDLNAGKLTAGSGSSLKVHFEACPEVPITDFNHFGRLVISPTSDNKCLTISNPTGAPPYYAHSATCISDTKPPASQLWGYGNDFGKVIHWSGSSKKSCGDTSGIYMNSAGYPVLGAGKQVEIGCPDTAGGYESFNIGSTLTT